MGRSYLAPAEEPPPMVTVQYNPFVPEIHANPYPLYRQLREEDPVHWSPLLESWILTRYDDVLEVLKHPQFSADRRRARNRFVEGAGGGQGPGGGVAGGPAPG